MSSELLRAKIISEWSRRSGKTPGSEYSTVWAISEKGALLRLQGATASPKAGKGACVMITGHGIGAAVDQHTSVYIRPTTKVVFQ